MTEVKDITPDYEPVKLLRSLEGRAKESKAAFVILLNADDDSMYYEGCGVRAKDLLWALERMKKRVMNSVELD